MYNLLIHGAGGAWDKTAVVLDRGRYLEYTTDELKARLEKLDDTVIAELTGFPALFAYESGHKLPARVGRIKTVQRRQIDLRITFEFDPSIPPIDSQKIESLEWDLDIGRLELNRTHWAVKEIDLLAVLHKAGIVSSLKNEKDVAKRYSRRMVTIACDILKTIGHTEFDKLLAEMGIDDVEAGRDQGGLLARSVALAKYTFAHMEQATAEGEALSSFVVRRAAEIDARRQPLDVDEARLAQFRAGLNAAGFSHAKEEHFRATAGSDNTVVISNVVTHNFYTDDKPTKVFIVHGREDAPKYEIAHFLRQIGLEPIILHERANGGRTLISKFQEESGDIEFAVVLMTPDDIGGLRDGPQNSRARQNVIFELGFFIGKFGAPKVCALVAGDIEKPSDFDGVVYVEYGPRTAWKMELARELRHAGVKFDPNKVF